MFATSLGHYLTPLMASSAFDMWLLLLTCCERAHEMSRVLDGPRGYLGSRHAQQCAISPQPSFCQHLLVQHKCMCRQLCWDNLVQRLLKLPGKKHQFVVGVYFLYCRSGGQLWCSARRRWTARYIGMNR
jgi:hypothetical protein